jgi:hypothetical protein
MNDHIDPLFRNILNAAAPRECAECRILDLPGHRHAHGCSKYVPLREVPYGPDGFVRTAAGHIEGFATANAAPRVRAPRVAAIGNGLFVRVGTGRKKRRAA